MKKEKGKEINMKKVEPVPLSQEILERIHEVEQEILDVFVQICEENQLHYYLCYGTLLGAVRHKGSIPWDDDMDICMPREDFEKFKKIVLPKSDESRYHLVCFENDPGLGADGTMRFMKRGTVYKESWREGLNPCYEEMFIDIFPMDNEPNKMRINDYLTDKILRRLILNKVRTSMSGRRLRGKILHFLLQPFSLHWLVACREKVIYKWNNQECKYYVVWGIQRNRIPKAWFEPSTKLLYDGKYYYAPGNWDKVLTQLYGDYMTPPPVEERKGHHGVVEIKL